MTMVLAAAIYPMQAAATRLRLAPVVDALIDAGVSTDLLTFLDDKGLAAWLTGGQARLRPGLHGLSRIPEMLRAASSCEMLLLQREALPVNSLVVERRAVQRGVPVIWDVDDALWEQVPRLGWARGGAEKYRWLARHATEVWAGSRHVADWAEAAGARKVMWVPATVPVAQDVSQDEREDDLLVWIGTPSSGPYIEALLHLLNDSISDWRVLVLGAAISVPNGLRMTQKPWSIDAETNALRRATVGIYPLDTSKPTTAGKSALKAVMYMANGIPLIATPTRSNRDVMTDGKEGLFASTTGEWCEALAVMQSPSIRLAMGEAGRQRAREQFDSAAWAQRLAGRVISLVEGKGEPPRPTAHVVGPRETG